MQQVIVLYLLGIAANVFLKLAAELTIRKARDYEISLHLQHYSSATIAVEQEIELLEVDVEPHIRQRLEEDFETNDTKRRMLVRRQEAKDFRKHELVYGHWFVLACSFLLLTVLAREVGFDLDLRGAQLIISVFFTGSLLVFFMFVWSLAEEQPETEPKITSRKHKFINIVGHSLLVAFIMILHSYEKIAIFLFG